MIIEPGGNKKMDLRLYLRQQPVMVALLVLLAILFFLAVTGLSRAYHAQRDFLGNRWFSRGIADLNAQHFDSAVTEFRAGKNRRPPIMQT